MPTSLFDVLSTADAERVRAAGTSLTLPEGWTPIGEKTPADKAYIIESGEVSVRRRGEEIARLGEGQIIGEAAIVNRTLRSATIVALTPLRVLHLTSEQLQGLISELPSFKRALDEAAAERLGD